MSIKKSYEKGYYVLDGYGDLNKVDDRNHATHYYDGYDMVTITNTNDDDFSMFSRWKD